MIDVVFLLLVFFILTFKIVAIEGDFNISTHTAYAAQAPAEPSLLPMEVRLVSDTQGRLKEVLLNGRCLSGEDPLSALRLEVMGILEAAHDAQDAAEVQFESDYDLKYDHLIDAITAVSGYRDDDGNIIKLVGNIKFVPARHENEQ
jgi:biopolymer transport protein ExbD